MRDRYTRLDGDSLILVDSKRDSVRWMEDQVHGYGGIEDQELCVS